MSNKKIDPEEMNNLQEQLSNDSFVNEGGMPIMGAISKEKKTPTLTNNTRVVFSEETNREGTLDDG